MAKFTYNDMLKDARLRARQNGLVLKTDNSCTINGSKAFKLTDRVTGTCKYSAMSLNCAYQTLLNNY